ncbi:hypothetical protein Brsp01_32640 [Brucella sp. NBRC 12950]|nr:hypothetical protein Brsp01_32640 [Brucella sp. NBRC 12950]
MAITTTLEDGSPVVRVLPVTHTPPQRADEAIEIPAATKRRLGLDEERSWIVLSESNRFAWPGPDLRPVDGETGYYGPVPPALFAEIRQRFVALARSARHRQTHRSE